MIVTQEVLKRPVGSGRGIAVPFADLRAQYAQIGEEVMGALREVVESAAFVLGPKVAEFERDFAAYVGVKHCVGV
ncbi:MAG TPA: DegT/DnrJ/EryC1/StrS family aminotransferase, partial [Tepidisphaeraceae bacterium]|nr:DegT/DnrJ/EryC1/StrS family aminotransferase [Tepidisphaeraceae bacterium]